MKKTGFETEHDVKNRWPAVAEHLFCSPVVFL